MAIHSNVVLCLFVVLKWTRTSLIFAPVFHTVQTVSISSSSTTNRNHNRVVLFNTNDQFSRSHIIEIKTLCSCVLHMTKQFQFKFYHKSQSQTLCSWMLHMTKQSSQLHQQHRSIGSVISKHTQSQVRTVYQKAASDYAWNRTNDVIQTFYVTATRNSCLSMYTYMPCLGSRTC